MPERLICLAVRVLMLSWEYPPLVVGGLGRHVEALARELVALGHEVQVVTRGEKDEIVDEVLDGVRVRRAAADPLAIDFATESLLAWSQAMEHSLLRAALPLVRRHRPDLVHAHDWLVGQSGQTLAQATAAPLVVTVHATEAGRNQGWLPKPLNLAIHSVERWLAQSADAVVSCSRTQRDETARLFELDPRAIDVVPNGVDARRWRVPAGIRDAVRARYAGDGPLVTFAGRLVHEKGVQTLLAAMRPLRERQPGLRLVVAGTGPHEQALRARVRRLGIARSVEFVGFVADDEVAALFAASDVAVVPSLYEPFGIVALEAAAARVPLVAAETGGLVDLIADGVATASFPAADVAALVGAVDGVLADSPGTAGAVARAARVIERDYTWTAVAEHTAAIYRRVGAR
jgi:glycogen(starch) synthase